MAAKTHCVLFGTLLLSCLAGSAARAETEPARSDTAKQGRSMPSRRTLQRARRHYDAGTLHYAAANYGAALVEFREAYHLSRLPDLLYNLGKVSAKIGDVPTATRYLRGYLAERPDAPDAEAVRGEIARLEMPCPPLEAPVSTPTPLRPPWPVLGLLAGGTTLLVIGGGLSIGAAGASQGAQDHARALGVAGITLDVIGAAGAVAGLVWGGLWYRRHVMQHGY